MNIIKIIIYIYIALFYIGGSDWGGSKFSFALKKYLSRCSYMSWCPKGGSNVKTDICA